MSVVAVAPRPAPRLALRPARSHDAVFVWRWNNAPEVRAVSRDPRPIRLPDHIAWWAARLAGGAPTWIVEVDGAPVGVVRLDPAPTTDAPERARISIALAAEARGRGLGRRAIGLACAAHGAPVLAEIAPANLASRASFEAAGFALVADTPALLTYLWTPAAPETP